MSLNDIRSVFIERSHFTYISSFRWVDKSIQFIVCENASTAVSFEHAWGDGVAVLRLFNEVYDETTKRPRPLTPPTSPASLPEKLSFNLSDGVKKAIDKGRKD